ncbi:MAG: ComEC/Rec2 family competence protein [Victivallaceae bacterium]|nr:ComEC/Rec2 family competence protein [Victivallaceae bacterium]
MSPSSNTPLPAPSRAKSKFAPTGIFALALTTGCAAGIALARPEHGAAAVFGIVAGTVFAALFPRRYAVLFGVALALGFTSARFRAATAPVLEARFGEIEARIVDSNCCRVPGIDPPASYRAELFQDGKVFPVSLSLVGDRRMLPFGAVLRGHGNVVPLDDPYAADGFGAYAAARNFAGSVFMNDAVMVGKRPDKTMEKLLAFRDLLIERTTRFIDSDDERNTVAALLFGVRGGMRGERRQKFVDSGTVHLFSVSGMHVSVLAAILLFLLRAIPFRARYMLLTLFLGAYTLCTGANPPATRAFFMIALWAAGKIFLRETPTVELLGMIAFAMLLYNPALLGDVGAQYSFFITAILLCAGDGARRTVPDGAVALMTQEEAHIFRKKRSFARFLPDAFFFCAAAFGAGVGISLLAGYSVRPGSIITNLLFVVGAVPLFSLGALGCAVPCIGIGGESAFRIAARWCETGAEFFAPLDAVTPPVYEVLLFSSALLVGFAARRFALKVAAGALLLILGTSWIVRGEFRPDAVGIFSSDCASPPAIVITENRFHRAVCINLPENRETLEKYLRARGISAIDTLFLTENNRRSCGCLIRLDPGFRPRRMIFPGGNAPPSRLYGYLEEYVRRTDLAPALPAENPRLETAKEKLTLEYFFPRDNVCLRLTVSDSDRGRRFTGTIDGETLFDEETMWAKKPVLHSYDVRRPR